MTPKVERKSAMTRLCNHDSVADVEGASAFSSLGGFRFLGSSDRSKSDVNTLNGL